MAEARTLTAAVHREEDWYVAQCLEVDVASQGRTIDEALASLAEAVGLYLDEVDDPARYVSSTPLVTSFALPAARARRAAGFERVRVKGSHAVCRDADGRVAVVPEHGRSSAGPWPRSCARQA